MTAADVLIVGAGLAGASCARTLTDAGVAVRVVERGRAPGGRMASPEQHGRRVDLGAAYFTVTDDDFARAVSGWQSAGLVAEWTDTFDVYGPDGQSDPTTGPMRWAASGGLRGVVRTVLDGIDVTLGAEVQQVTYDGSTLLVDGRPEQIVVLAQPDPQAARLLPTDGELAPLRSELSVPYDPVLSISAGWAEREWPFADGAFVNDHPILTFVADDGARRGDGAPVVVAHTTPDFARQYYDDPGAAEPPVLEALAEQFGITAAPTWVESHRWGLAKPAGQHDRAFAWHSPSAGLGVGVTNDAWCPSGSPRVESAWLSGRALARHLLTDLKP